ncbi:GntR family transcriptional regulator [Desulfoscipio gibsoniae]|uniref:Putative transcriptional regulator n=1 Tax=Desulfoscipio gibsoniae DSM 7213 TaxID=767817 RepID=R4KRT3_9FIRM|nr:GntR family transcriptional regulator [Desulfoscipio gibsoniae]AGL03290.1 putative transcriptional regulator [Desulfoscipio gibsoniae DSM 7213]
MFDLDLRSRHPIYEQLVERFKELIISEVLKTDEQLPSVRVLASQLTINPNTIQKAYREMERQGYIYSIPGKGNFVARVMREGNAEKLARLREELVKILSEAIYLGMKKEEIIKIISELYVMVKGGEKSDRS